MSGGWVSPMCRSGAPVSALDKQWFGATEPQQNGPTSARHIRYPAATLTDSRQLGTDPFDLVEVAGHYVPWQSYSVFVRLVLNRGMT